ncbi:DEAD/DEAH box helicase [Vagococcus fluvialis]|uniref:DEAD/DEAH box helicase n=1 Tax=Vagococcus fluvialis TaxID=2738 RepID=UPI001A8DB6BE|nr:ATP-binding domain-containing protein [Vagococcus fluvialis]MBO0427824.1 DEAD/DEAH box helicase [Vagococcus fluvialis]
MLEKINSLPIGNAISQDIEKIIENLSKKYDGTVYYNFALTEMESEIIKIHILFETKQKGVFAVNLSSIDLENDRETIDKIHVALKNYLMNYGKLRNRRELAIPLTVVNLIETEHDIPENADRLDYVTLEEFESFFNELEEIEEKYYKPLNEALDKIISAKPAKPRNNVIKNDSKGGIIKEIEKQIAFMDRWQRKAAYEIPDTPQRIRGLAGSGKTIVLALKAAYIHFLYPERDIAVTFYSRTLYQQFKSLISEFFSQYSKQRSVDFNKVHILHAWGTMSESGIYAIVAEEMDSKIYTYNQAKAEFGAKDAFKGACHSLLINMEMKGVKNLELYDYILIDEAQDLPTEFFRIAYSLFKDKKRLVYAYDELQSLEKDSFMPSVREMFGVDERGNNLVTIDESRDSDTDIILPICYRNNMWNLTMAHALGFGIYGTKNSKLTSNFRGVQFFKDLSIWSDIGYEAINGTTLDFNRPVQLKRRENATPGYFFDLMKAEDSFKIKTPFSNKEEEYRYIASSIKKNIEQDELDPDDILVIFSNSQSSYNEYDMLTKYLNMVGVKSIMPGKDVNRDTFTVSQSITCTHIYRAKGNERPMVYICGAEYFGGNLQNIEIRNMLFTAITRSRAWVRMTGTGVFLNMISNEINEVISNDYVLKMDVPTPGDIELLNVVNADIQSSSTKAREEKNEKTDNFLELVKNKEYGDEEVKEFIKFLQSQLDE